jgi:hypothetical protein
MSRYRVEISTKLNVTVLLDADSEEDAADAAWEAAQQYAHTVNGADLGDVTVDAEADFDGIGADEVTEVSR